MHQHHAFYCSDCTFDQAELARQPQKMRRLCLAFLLIVSVAAGECWAGAVSHSLALQAEAGHMMADGLAIALALLATWISQFPASGRATFGHRRIEILAALVNSVGLLVVAALIAWEAVEHLQSPPQEILSQPMLITATLGLCLNTLNALLLHSHSQSDLNLRGAFLHMVADAISSVGVIGAAIAVWAFHWLWVDGVISLGVALLISTGAIPLLRQSLSILLEQAPIHLDSDQIQAYLEAQAGVAQVKSLRVWTLAPGQTALMAALTVESNDGVKRDRLLRQLKTALQAEFGIQEIVLELSASTALTLATLPAAKILEFIETSEER